MWWGLPPFPSDSCINVQAVFSCEICNSLLLLLPHFQGTAILARVKGLCDCFCSPVLGDSLKPSPGMDLFQNVPQFFMICFSIVTTWLGSWALGCPDCSQRPSWNQQRWGKTSVWPTTWDCFFRRPTSSGITWRTCSRDESSGRRR